MSAKNKIQNNPNVIFFDLDGTLVEFCINYLEARREAISLIEKQGLLGDLKFTLKDSIFFMDREIKRLLKSNDEPAYVYEKIHSQLMEIVEKYELEAAKKTKLLPFVRETLEELKMMGMKLILFTADGDNAMNIIVKKTAIDNLFETLISRGSSIEVKPHPRHIITALSSSNSKPEEIVFVGDSVADIVSGKYINAITIGVTTGLGNKQQLMEAGADYLIDSISELPVLIKKIWNDDSCQ